MFWQCTFKVPDREKDNVTESVGRDTVLYPWITQDTHSPSRFWSPLTEGCTSAWLELPFSPRIVFKQPTHHCNKSSVPTLLPVSAWTLSFCCCKSHPKHFTAYPPRLSGMRTFPISGISVTKRKTSILSVSHEYSRSVHHSSEMHICTAWCKVKRMCTPA